MYVVKYRNMMGSEKAIELKTKRALFQYISVLEDAAISFTISVVKEPQSLTVKDLLARRRLMRARGA